MLVYRAALDWTVCHWNANLATAKWLCATHLILLCDTQFENPGMMQWCKNVNEQLNVQRQLKKIQI